MERKRKYVVDDRLTRLELLLLRVLSQSHPGLLSEWTRQFDGWEVAQAERQTELTSTSTEPISGSGKRENGDDEGVFLDRLMALAEMWARNDSDQPDLSWASRTLRAVVDEKRAK